MRSDCHRPGAIVPRDYSYVCSYDMGGISEPPWNAIVARELCVKAVSDGFKVFGCPGKCGVCGACYRYGDVWRHSPTGDLVHVGHDCADKYAMLAERDDFNAHLEMVKRARKAAIEAERRKCQRERLFARYPGLAEALEVDHYIVRDIRSRLFNQGYDLSEKQIALVFKLAKEAAEKAAAPPKPEEKKVPAPVSNERQVIRGVLVSKKHYEGPYGSSIKGTVKVSTPDGVWLCWGTLPSSILLSYDAAGNSERVEVGDEIEFSAKLVAGERDPHFAFFKRPTNARVVSKKEEKDHEALRCA